MGWNLTVCDCSGCADNLCIGRQPVRREMSTEPETGSTGQRLTLHLQAVLVSC